MADPIAVKSKRDKATLRIRNVAPEIAKRFGVEFAMPSVNARIYPDLYDAELSESVANLLETIADQPAPAVAGNHL